MLNKFFKDNIESRNPATRLTAVERLNESNSEDQQKLVRVAVNETDDGVRCAAVAKLTDAQCLAALLGDTQPSLSETAGAAGNVNSSPHSVSLPLPATVKEAARRRLEHLLCESGLMDSTSNARLAASGSREACVLIACHSADEASRNAVMIMLDEQSDVARVVTDSRYHSTRVAASERLTDASLMSKVASAIKERDKVVSRSLQEKSDANRAATLLAEQHQQEISHLIAGMQLLSDSVWSPQYAGRYFAAQERWKKLDPLPTSDQTRRFEASSVVAAKLVEQEESRQMAKDYCAEALKTQIALGDRLKSTPLAELTTQINQVRQQSVNAQASWRVSVAAAAPDAALIKTYDNTLDGLQSKLQEAEQLLSLELATVTPSKLSAAETKILLKAVSTHFGGTQDFDPEQVALKDCQYLTDAAAICRQLGSRDKQLDNENDAKVKSIQKQLGALAAALREGKWSPGNSLYLRLAKKIEKLAGHAEQKSLADRLTRHKTKLDELADWQNFAAKPKLEALCEQMEVLPAEQLKVNDLGTRIKDLQNEWKELGASPIANELWDRFKAAADVAYEPVGKYRTTQQQEREKKQAEKVAICVRLEAFLAEINWAAADWKLIEKTVRSAKTGWRNNRVLNRKPDRAQEQRFTDLVTQFNAKLDPQYDANAEAKQALIDKIEKLADAEINQHVVNQTRKLQNSWKQPGIMRRKQDQELWEKFNGYCRDIYKQHHAAEKQKTDSSLVHVKQAKDLIRSIRDLCKKPDADEKAFTNLQQQFSALAEFPEKEKKFLLREFNQASVQFSQLKEKSQSQAAIAEWTDLQRRSLLCIRYEALVGGVPDEQLLEDLNNEWNETTTVLPKDWGKKIERRKAAALTHIANATQYDFAEAEKNRRLMCINAEILSGVDTPAEDKPLRMEYQLENLQQGLGSSAVTDGKTELRKLSVEWLCMPPGDPSNRERLESRFQSAMKQ